MLCDLRRAMKVFLIVLVVSSTTTFNLKTYTQNDYLVSSERAEVLFYNRTYLGNFEVTHTKYNRTHFGMNITGEFVMDLNYSLSVDIQGYRFASNEYRIFPLTFSYNFCEALFVGSFGFRDLFEHGHMFKCPMKKGVYGIYDWVPDFKKFPPGFPRGRYMIDIMWMYYKILVTHAQWYIKIEDDLKHFYN